MTNRLSFVQNRMLQTMIEMFIEIYYGSIHCQVYNGLFVF